MQHQQQKRFCHCSGSKKAFALLGPSLVRGGKDVKAYCVLDEGGKEIAECNHASMFLQEGCRLSGPPASSDTMCITLVFTRVRQHANLFAPVFAGVSLLRDSFCFGSCSPLPATASVECFFLGFSYTAAAPYVDGQLFAVGG